MSWFKIDDKFHSHPKVLEAGNAAIGLYVRCGAYCAAHLTDGKVPKNLAKTYGNLGEIRALLRVGLWVETDDGYEMHDYLEYNPSRLHVVGERDAAKERMARLRSGNVRANTKRTNKRTSATPTRPVPQLPTRASQNAIWDTLAQHFGTPATAAEKGNRGRHVKQLLEIGATPEEIHRRIQEHTNRRENWTLTANALLTHWTDLAPRPDRRRFDPDTGALMAEGL